MALVLIKRSDVDNPEAFTVMSRDIRVGIVTKLRSGVSDLWIWSITGVPAHLAGLGPGHGSAASLDEAMQALDRRWRHWLDSAGLDERADAPGD